MAQRGRKSSASLAVVPVVPLAPQGRPEPPEHLNEAEATEWRELVAAMRSDWFGRESHGLLERYVRHVCLARLIANVIPAQIGDDIAAFDKLTAMHARESQAISSLATRMRLTHQSARDSKTLRREEHAGPKPWEIRR